MYVNSTQPQRSFKIALQTTATPQRSWSDARREGKQQSSAPAPTPAASGVPSMCDNLLSYLMEPPTPPKHLPKHKVTDAEGDVMLYWHLQWLAVPDLARVMNHHIFTFSHLIISYWGPCLINQRTVSSFVLSPIIPLFITEAVLMSDTRPTHG